MICIIIPKSKGVAGVVSSFQRFEYLSGFVTFALDEAGYLNGATGLFVGRHGASRQPIGGSMINWFKAAVILICFWVFTVNTATAIEYKKCMQDLNHKNPEIQQAAKIYITGAGTAYMYANAELRVKKKKPLFCQPKNISLGTNKFIQFIKEQAASYQKKGYSEKEINNAAIELLLLRALISAYPCK
jgi:hypothetical protein